MEQSNTNADQSEKSESFMRISRIFAVVIGILVLGWFVFTNATSNDSSHAFKLGLDLAGGSHLVYEADTQGLNQAEIPELMGVLRDVIERRINVFGVSEPIVQIESSSAVAETKSERLIVELPGVTDVNDAVAEIGRTPLLEFKLIDRGAMTAMEQRLISESQTEAVATGGKEVKNVKEETSNNIDPYIDTELTGRYLQSAALNFAGGQSGSLANEPIVSITFNATGADLFEQITRDNVGEQLAIFLDGEMLSAPVINQPISGGRATISGGFTPEEAKALAQNLNFGALPVPIELVGTQTIGASLGVELLEKGVLAGALGLLFIMVFMMFWYRALGLAAAVSLLGYVVMMLALFQFVPVTLTAAGLAGFVLSLGMAVDANVLVFERIKEEWQAGKTMRAAAQDGFARAWSAIRDGNVTSLLSAIILFWFGTSIVKGFALVFGLGVIVSMVSALLVTRWLTQALPDVKKDAGGLWPILYRSGFKRSK